MRKARVGLGLLAGCLVFWGSTARLSAATVADALRFTPKQEGANCYTPTAQEEATCKLDWVRFDVPAGKQKGSAWILRTADGKILRRFTDNVGDGQIHIWSYFQKDGIEVYREIDTDANRRPDQYRWLNANGMKWGIDANEDGKIDTWKAISPEEVCQEAIQALAADDLARFQALLITEADIKALDLPAAEATRLRELRTKAAAKFQNTRTKVTLSDKTRILHLETVPPQCVPAEQNGARLDLVKHQSITILCDTAGKNDWLQTGEVIQVGAAWRLIDAPVQGAEDTNRAGSGAPVDDETPEVKALLKQLSEQDASQPKPGAAAAEYVGYHLKRVDILEKILAKKPQDADQRVREMADGLSAAAQNSLPADKTAYDRLLRLEKQMIETGPKGSNLAAYVMFREMQADYASKLSTNKDLEKVQKEWLDRLARFVQDYPKAEDTAEALIQLGMVSEFVGDEIAAKRWYEQLVRDFSDKPIAARAGGAKKRLELEGKALELAAPMLGTGTAFDVAQLRNKLVVVYYWASWNQQCLGDFAKLKLLLDEYGSKGLELVCVNLDNTADEARNFLTRSPAPGVHLFKAGDQASGLESPLATQYGIMVLPNMFLVGKDGKVISRTVQVGNLAEEIKKQLK